MQFLTLVAFGCMVWAGAMTLLYIIAANDVRKVKEELADQERRFTDAETIEQIYQAKVDGLVSRLRMAAPWMLYEDEHIEAAEVS